MGEWGYTFRHNGQVLRTQALKSSSRIIIVDNLTLPFFITASSSSLFTLSLSRRKKPLLALMRELRFSENLLSRLFSCNSLRSDTGSGEPSKSVSFKFVPSCRSQICPNFLLFHYCSKARSEVTEKRFFRIPVLNRIRQSQIFFYKTSKSS